MAVAIVLILGYISVACWSLLFVPQIVKNYRGANAEGLSLLMCTMWAVSGFSVDAYYVRAPPIPFLEWRVYALRRARTGLRFLRR